MDGDGGMDTYSYVCMGMYGRDILVGLWRCLLFVVIGGSGGGGGVSRPRRIEISTLWQL